MGILTRRFLIRSSLTAQIYTSITLLAREPIFFKDYKIPDTPQGRFEMLALHSGLFMHCLKSSLRDKEAAAALLQDLCDCVVADMEESLRAMRLKESKIPFHLKKFVEGFYGRLLAYDEALGLKDKALLEQAIGRNIYEGQRAVGDNKIKDMASYVFELGEWMQNKSMEKIIRNIANRPQPLTGRAE